MNDAAETFDDVLNAYLDMIRAGTVPTTGGDNAGSVPTPEEYAAAHPEFADELRESLPLLLEMERIGASYDAPAMSEETVPDFSGTNFRNRKFCVAPKSLPSIITCRV